MKQWKRKQWLNDWKLYGKKQPHDLSKGMPRNELKDLVIRQNIAAQIQLKTVHGKTKTVAQIGSRKTAGSFPSIYYVMSLTFYLKIFP